MTRLPRRTLFLGAILLVATAYMLMQSNSRDSPSISGTELIPAQSIGDFNLQDVYGHPFTRAQVLGRWTVVTLGFTRCPDVCPLSLASFRDELNALPLNSRNRIQFVFVSVDPEYDTVESLRAYVQKFHTAILPVRGTLPELKAFASHFSGSFAKEGQGTVGLYTMVHSPQFFVINPEGRWQVLYSPPLVKGSLAVDLKSLTRPKRFGIF